MADTTAVALLFDDEDLGAQLRQALHERGAHIVHESAVSALDCEVIEQVAPDVLVVSLDDSLDEELDALYELIDGTHTRVVFNDAQASRALEGWDRARWARHLAAKVLAKSDIDPPRPGAAPESAAPAMAHVDEALMASVGAGVAEPSWAGRASHLEPDLKREKQITAESDMLAAELEALLANVPVLSEESAGAYSFESATEQDAQIADSAGPRSMPGHDVDQTQSIGLWEGASPHESRSDAADEAEAASSSGPAPIDAPPAPDMPLHEKWTLVDVEAVVPASAPSQPLEAENFGIEKLTAADYLAPPADSMSPAEDFSVSLELVSLEESMAPQPYQSDAPAPERGELDCVVLVGASVNSGQAVRTFFAALPPGLPCAFVLVQHLGAGSAEELVRLLAQECAVPVWRARNTAYARAGEVVVVPAGEQLTLLRDGSIDLQPTAGFGASSPSIDATFSLVAKVFGGDASAIVFAGPGNDAVAGCQAVHDRGGRVWVEQSDENDFTDMVNAVGAERLASATGQPQELAMRLIQEYL